MRKTFLFATFLGLVLSGMQVHAFEAFLLNPDGTEKKIVSKPVSVVATDDPSAKKGVISYIRLIVKARIEKIAINE